MKFWLAGLGISLLLVVTVFTLATNLTPSRQDQNTNTCPTDATFTQIWNSWSYDYINKNPYNSVEEQMQDWNALMQINGCGEEWYDPLADLIEQQAASATPVYWEHDAN